MVICALLVFMCLYIYVEHHQSAIEMSREFKE
jgi:hypothetical protein